MTPLGIVIAGVGGQGAATAAQLLASSAIAQGLHAKVYETRGLARRGGVVTTQVRIANQPHFAPRCPPDGVHVVIGLEPVESVRCARGYPGACVLTVGKPLLPSGVFHDDYPDLAVLEAELAQRDGRSVFLDTPKLSGPPNLFALGALAALGATGTGWEALQAATVAKLGQRAVGDLEKGRDGVAARELSDAWRQRVPTFQE